MVFAFIAASGWTSIIIGGVLSIVANSKGKEARSLDGVTYIETLSELRHNLVAAVPLLVAIAGRAWSSQPVKCELSEGEGAIVEFREEKKVERRGSIVSGGVWVADSELLRASVKECEWALADGSGPWAYHIPVIDGRKARGDFMQMSGDVLKPAEKGLLDAVIESTVGYRNIGIRKSERFLPMGTAVTVVGEIVNIADHPGTFKGGIRSDGGQLLAIRPPQSGPFIISRQSFPTLLHNAHAQSQAFSKLSVMFISTGVSLLAVSFAHKAWLWLRMRQIRGRIEKARRKREAALQAGSGRGAEVSSSRNAGAGQSGGGEQPGLMSTCAICWDKQSDMVYPACGHLCICSQCVAQAGASVQRCPMCRRISQPIKVYTT